MVDWFNPTSNPAGDETGKLADVYGGLNVWIKGHSLNVKAQFGASRAGTPTGSGEWKMSGLAQTQLSL
jgi:hypothetical protein